MLIHVVQGERELVKDCRSLARFDLKDIDPMPAGMARIEVRFLIDANGILNVTARDQRTGKEQSVDVKPSYGLTDEQVERHDPGVVRESRRGLPGRGRCARRASRPTRFWPRSRRRGATTRISSCPTTERAAIDTAVNELLLVYHSDDHGLILDKIEQLNQATMDLAENMMNTAVRGALKGTKID